jgi:DNA-binding NarL/FixJ family response regulator
LRKGEPTTKGGTEMVTTTQETKQTKKKLTPEQIKTIKKLTREGVMAAAIAREMGLAPNVVHYHAKKVRRNSQRRSSGRSTVTPHHIDAVKALAEKGFDFKTIGEKTGLSGQTVSNILKGKGKYGSPRKKPTLSPSKSLVSDIVNEIRAELKAEILRELLGK